MKNKIKILLVLVIVGVCYATAYAVDITAATNVQLLEQYLMPNESLAKKQKALEGARFQLGLSDTASAATVANALKVQFRKWLREGYLAKQQSLNQLKYRVVADSITTNHMW